MSVSTILAAHLQVGDWISPAKRGPFRQVVGIEHHPLSVRITLAARPGDIAHSGRYRIRPGHEKAFWVQDRPVTGTPEVSA